MGHTIMVNELVPIVVAAAVWGARWSSHVVLAQSDNMAVVEVLNHGYCRDADIMHLMRCLFFIRAHHNYTIFATHVKGHLLLIEKPDWTSANWSSLFAAIC